MSGIIILLAERSRRALLQVEAARQTLEEKVDERTRELQVALANLQAEIKVRAEAEEARRRISARMLNIQDEERRRIARELHDSIGQTLAALKMTISTLSKMTSATAQPSPAVSKCWDDVNSLIDEAIRETRTISHLLHPPMLDELGFAASASWYITGFARRSGIEVNVELPDEQPRFTESMDLTLFRALQECLTNILRHSGSKKAEVRLEHCRPGGRSFHKGLWQRHVPGPDRKIHDLRHRCRSRSGWHEGTRAGLGRQNRIANPGDRHHRKGDLAACHGNSESA